MTANLAKRLKNALSDRNKVSEKSFSIDLDLIEEDLIRDPILMPYQINWVNSNVPIQFDEKSRQIGWSFTMALRAVLRGIENIRNSLYTSYNQDSAKQFIKDCKYWAQIFNIACKVICNEEFVSDEGFCVFEVHFLNGRVIQATAGNPENLRGKPGYDVYLDEIAYRQHSIEEILAAASATLIHGGTIRAGSTHAGIDSDFNKTIQKITNGDLKYGHSKVTFKDAVKQGLYKRICIKNDTDWDQESEDKWVKEIYDLYGIRAVEELDATPSDFSGGGKVFNDSIFYKISLEDFSNLVNNETIYIRYYDLASSTDANAYYSASVKVALVDLLVPFRDGHRTIDKVLIICDYEAKQLDPIEGTDNILETVRTDSEYTFHIIEKEPGSSGSRYNAWLANELDGYLVYDYQPKISKLQRAIPASNAVSKTEIRILNTPKMREFISLISKFDGSKKELVNDLTDCISGVYDWYRNSNSFFQ